MGYYTPTLDIIGYTFEYFGSPLDNRYILFGFVQLRLDQRKFEAGFRHTWNYITKIYIVYVRRKQTTNMYTHFYDLHKKRLA